MDPCAFRSGSLARSEALGAPVGGGLEAATEAGALLRAARTALFSLGNIAGHRASHHALSELDLGEALAPFEAHTDAVLREHAARVLTKLGSTS